MIEKVITGIIIMVILVFFFYFFATGIGITFGPQKTEPQKTDVNYLLSKLQNGNNTVVVVINNYNNLTQN